MISLELNVKFTNLSFQFEQFILCISSEGYFVDN